LLSQFGIPWQAVALRKEFEQWQTRARLLAVAMLVLLELMVLKLEAVSKSSDFLKDFFKLRDHGHLGQIKTRPLFLDDHCCAF